MVDRVAPILLRVVVGAMELPALGVLLAWIDLVVPGMILLFLPTVTLGAPVLVSASVRVRPDEVVYLPVAAQIAIIVIDMGLAAEVLPVMGVNAVLLVVVLAPWAPRSFEIEYVEIGIFRLHPVK